LTVLVLFYRNFCEVRSNVAAETIVSHQGCNDEAHYGYFN